MFAERLLQPELLDSAKPEEARLNLADLLRINRYFGGHFVIRKTLARVVTPGSTFTLLDIGAASGDTGRVIQAQYPHARVTNLDYNTTNLEAACQPKIVADAFALPFREGSFDYVMCSSFLHHFTDAQVLVLLRSFYCVARKALFVYDLERNILPYLFLPASGFLFHWQRITLHDGPISVRAAFHKRELYQLGRSAGLNPVEVKAHRPAFRLALVARKL